MSDRGAAGGLSEDGDLVRIAAEEVDVVLPGGQCYRFTRGPML
jgi:hypothetical protein